VKLIHSSPELQFASTGASDIYEIEAWNDKFQVNHYPSDDPAESPNTILTSHRYGGTEIAGDGWDMGDNEYGTALTLRENSGTGDSIWKLIAHDDNNGVDGGKYFSIKGGVSGDLRTSFIINRLGKIGMGFMGRDPEGALEIMGKTGQPRPLLMISSDDPVVGYGDYLIVKDDGNTGIGIPDGFNATIDVKLDVRGASRFVRAGDPSSWSNPVPGELAYSNAHNTYYYYDGSGWVSLGGDASGTCYIDHTGTCRFGSNEAENMGYWGMCDLGGGTSETKRFYVPPGVENCIDDNGLNKGAFIAYREAKYCCFP